MAVKAFWRSFFKVNGELESGGPTYVSGWINVLFPYIHKADGLQPNPYVATWESSRGKDTPAGPCEFEFGPGLSLAPFVWQYLGRPTPMEFLGGFLGVRQNPETLAMRPAIGCALHEA